MLIPILNNLSFFIISCIILFCSCDGGKRKIDSPNVNVPLKSQFYVAFDPADIDESIKDEDRDGSNWQKAYKDINEAIDNIKKMRRIHNTNEAVTILVKAGRYLLHGPGEEEGHRHNTLIYLEGGENITIIGGFESKTGFTDTILTQNKKSLAIDMHGSKAVKIENFTISDEGKYENSIHIYDSKNIELKKLKIFETTTVEFSNIDGLRLYDSEFKNNKNNRNGALYIRECSNASLNDNKFSFNWYAIYIYDGKNISLVNNQFFANKNHAIGASEVDNFRVEKNEFKDNSEGASISILKGKNVKLTENVFNSNNSPNYGGALYVSGNTDGISIENNHFISNKITERGGPGGALAIDNSTSVIIIGNTVDGNVSEVSGGGAYISNSQITKFEDNKFQRNRALNNSGGGVFFAKSTIAVFKNNIFDGNTITRPGITIGNKSASGPAIFLEDMDASKIDFSSSKFSNHNSVKEGSLPEGVNTGTR